MSNKCNEDKYEINLYLDDIRDCPEGYVLAQNIKEAIYYLKKYKVNKLSLDHDLGEDSEGNLLPTGYDLVKYFCEHGLHANEIRLHTANPVGRENMYSALIAAQKRGFIDKDIQILNT